MRILKALLITGLIVIALLNYKIMSFEGGFKFVKTTEEELTLQEQIEELSDIQGLYYYKNPFNDETYVAILETKENLYMDNSATKTEIDALTVAGSIITTIKPEPLSIFPWWAYLIILVIIIFIPVKKRS